MTTTKSAPRGRPLWQQLSDRLSDEIRSGARQPGSKLPSVAQIEETDGLSQTTTMRAYRALADAGLVETRTGSGTYVVDTLPDPEEAATVEALRERVRQLEEHLGDMQRQVDDRLSVLEAWKRRVEGAD